MRKKKKKKQETKLTRAMVFGAGVDEVHESSAAIKLGEEDSGVGLRLRALDPLKTRPNTTIFATTFSEYSATIATHPHFFFFVESDEIKERREVFFVFFCFVLGGEGERLSFGEYF